MNEAIRSQALSLFKAGVVAANPARAVDKSINDKALPKVDGKYFVISVGKAAIGMAEAALSHLPNVEAALVVTNYENATELQGAKVLAAGHPVPDQNGAAASQAVIDLLGHCGADDHVLALFSGGGSALLPAPIDGITLADKAKVSRLLLSAGIDIQGMNLVRQHLSKLKGGGLLRMAAPAKVTALILSDVVGDDLRVIASGPTVAPIGTRSDARQQLENAGIWDEMPVSVREHLIKDNDVAGDAPAAENRLIGSNKISLAAMSDCDPSAGVVTEPLVGDVEDAAGLICKNMRPGKWLYGGETTVRLTGTGLGGRNQELALRVALLAEAANWQGDWVFLSGGTDGRDGPTDAAGGLVDNGTLARMRAAEIDPQASLLDNDSYHALKASGDLLMIGATGTNVADLQVLIRT
ncbi:MAG: glycerate kinase type-2 family protein [Paracoccaceae bacterium]